MRFAVGLAVGVLVGFLARGWLRAPESRAVRDGDRTAALGPAQRAEPAPIPESAASAAPVAPAAAAPERRGPVFVRYWGSEVGTEGPISSWPFGGKMVFVPDGQVVAAAGHGVPELREALAEARAARDWPAYWQTLICLGRLGTPEAHAVLVEVMGDATLRLEGRWRGRPFYGWLKDADTAGLLEAARRRAEIEMVESPDTRFSGAGWLSLVALHGGEAEIAWIESVAGGARYDRALAEAARNPLAAARLGARIRRSDHALDSSGFDAFARENPAAAFDVAVDSIGAASDVSEFGRLLGKLTTQENFPRARAAILAIDPSRRPDALPAIEWIHRRGIDVSSLAEVIDEPRLILERTPSVPLKQQESERVLRALVAVRNWRVTWSDATLSAARALETHPDQPVAEEARSTVRWIVDQGSRPSDAWNPERGL